MGLFDGDGSGEIGGGGDGADLPGAGLELPECAPIGLGGDGAVIDEPSDIAGEGGGEFEHLLGAGEIGVDQVMGARAGGEDARGGADLGADGVIGGGTPCGVFGWEEEGAGGGEE